MRVLHVDTAREWRGGQTQLLHLARVPGAAVALPGAAALTGALAREGIPVWHVAFRAGILGTWGLQAAVRAWRPDVVAAHTSHAHSHAIRLRGIPVVVHRRVDFVPGRLSRAKYAAPRGYVAVSRAVRDVLTGSGVPADRIVVVHDGVAPAAGGGGDRAPTRKALGLADADRIVLAVGALVPHKGHIHLVDALPHLPAAVHAVVAGEGPLRRPLRARAKRLGVSTRLHLLGAREDVGALLAAADVFAHPSVEEGLGQAVVEARRAGLQVVASRAGGLPEVVGHTDRLVRPADAVALARGLRAALLEPRTGNDTLNGQFTVRTLVDETLGAYRRFARLPLRAR